MTLINFGRATRIRTRNLVLNMDVVPSAFGAIRKIVNRVSFKFSRCFSLSLRLGGDGRAIHHEDSDPQSDTEKWRQNR